METVSTSPLTAVGRNLVEQARELGPTLSRHIPEEENHRRIARPALDALAEAGFTRLFVPKSLGGLEADPLTTARVIEEIALHDTYAAWALMVVNTPSWWCSRLPERAVEEIYRPGGNSFIAASVHPPMQATRVEGGYRINGRNPLVSNVHEAGWLLFDALVMEGDRPILHDGHPEIINFILPVADCEILDTWYSLGMRGTDSNDVAIRDLFVPQYRTCPLTPEFEPSRHYTSLLYQYIAMGSSVACTIPPIALAVARNAINELKALAAKKTPMGSMVSIRERGTVQSKLGKAEALVQSSRAYLYQKIGESWNKTLDGQKLLLEEKADVLLAAAHTVQSCAGAVDMMYSAAGSSAIYTRNGIERHFRDMQVIRQHGFCNESRYETVAQVHLGLPPDLPFVAF